MDKILSRVGTVQRQAARRMAKEKRKGRIIMKHEIAKKLKEPRMEVVRDIREARRARAEDWNLGPLAPKRDVPIVQVPNAQTPKSIYGTLSVTRALDQTRMRPLDRGDRCRWAGGSKNFCLAVGDRVVLIEGPNKGKIDKVVAIDMEAGTVRLAESKVNITVPDHFVGFQGMADAVAMPERVSIGAVRLVHPIKDEETGVITDKIIRELKPVKMVYDKVTHTRTWSRMVPGLNVTIPWPKVEPTVHEESPNNTPRVHVEEMTFIPTLLTPPMPASIIDELRNPYSRFRTRHTEEYIAAKEAAEAEKKAVKEKSKEMLTPVQEFNRLEREKRRARGQPVLSEEMLAKIGEVMAKNLNGRKKKELSIPAEIKKPEEVQPAS